VREVTNAKKGRKHQDAAEPNVQHGGMRGATTNDAETTERLGRGLKQAAGGQAVDAMARAACFSPRQFHRLMVQHFGEAPGSHQRRLRLDRGAWLLLTSNATVLEIALETGFESHETFTRAFRARFGETPSSFRKSRGATLPRSIRIGLAMAMHAATRLHQSYGVAGGNNKL
jgi:transcriptional regulator GlxA family with amidase domain